MAVQVFVVTTEKGLLFIRTVVHNRPMHIDQIAIALFGALVAWLSQAGTDRFRRWACVFGMLGQPFWFWASWKAQQWGIFAVSAIYMCAWLRGLWVYWLRPNHGPSSAVGTIQLTPNAPPR